MKPLHIFKISPAIPENIARLQELAHNLWATWDIDALHLFRRLDMELWQQIHNNPVKLLGMISQKRLEECAANDGFLVHYNRVCQNFDHYMQHKTWRDTLKQDFSVAYFSAEFGLAECLRMYSGGLGVLSGDHLKSSSDLGLPLVGVGLAYQKGYFHQYLNANGWQQEEYYENDFYNLPMRQVLRDSQPLLVEVALPGRTVKIDVWQVQVGRVPLYMLNTNLEENHEVDRTITAHLYGGGSEMRVCQEIILGIGGTKALTKMGITPTTFHMNEGHSAFLGLERIRMLMKEHHISFAEARQVAKSGNVFTTHTPVPAGIDRFSPELMEKYFSDYYRELGLDRDQFLALGRENPRNSHESFCMAVLALRLADHSNGVSKLHGEVSRKMWQPLWPELPKEEVPIGHVTNGIHIKTWISPQMASLLERYMGLRWKDNPGDHEVWNLIDTIPDEELWNIHETRRADLVAYSRTRLHKQLQHRNASAHEIKRALEILNPETLTIGFARRFATYKRATLLLSDEKRLLKILQSPHPVQIIFAGKAHPRDEGGKKLISEIVHLGRREELRNKIVFLENYDIEVAKYMLQGVDVWLNTPRRPHEASGTSGMKATANGALNLSVLDGWWCEGYHPDLGWAIGAGEEYPDTEAGHAEEDKIEAGLLYDVLEQEVVPLFYDRDANDLPRKWIKKMKMGMKALCPIFNTGRMLQEYAQMYYIPASQLFSDLSANNCERGKALNSRQRHLLSNWHAIQAVEIRTAENGKKLFVGEEVAVDATLHLGTITPGEVQVEVYYGPIDAEQHICKAQTILMQLAESMGDGKYRFATAIPCRESGNYGFAVRILPQCQDQATPFQPGLIRWL